MKIKFKALNELAYSPHRAHPTDAGADLHASTNRSIDLLPGQPVLVSTGLAVAIPAGYVGLIHPRSGMAAKHGVTVLNAPGTIDSDYRGEVKVCLINHGKETHTIKPGDRIAQLVVQRVELPAFEHVDTLPDTARGEDGFGSTGA